MKKIEAIIRESKFEDVKEALEGIGVNFFTFVEVYGHGRQKGDAVTYRGAVYDSGDIPRILIELIVREERLDEVVDTLLTTGRTDTIGDGKIIVTNVEKFIRIRTGEKDQDAL